VGATVWLYVSDFVRATPHLGAAWKRNSNSTLSLSIGSYRACTSRLIGGASRRLHQGDRGRDLSKMPLVYDHEETGNDLMLGLLNAVHGAAVLPRRKRVLTSKLLAILPEHATPAARSRRR
jgi:hypothetical protein